MTTNTTKVLGVVLVAILSLGGCGGGGSGADGTGGSDIPGTGGDMTSTGGTTGTGVTDTSGTGGATTNTGGASTGGSMTMSGTGGTKVTVGGWIDGSVKSCDGVEACGTMSTVTQTACCELYWSTNACGMVMPKKADLPVASMVLFGNQMGTEARDRGINLKVVNNQLKATDAANTTTDRMTDFCAPGGMLDAAITAAKLVTMPTQ